VAQPGTAQDCYWLCRNPVSERTCGFKSKPFRKVFAIPKTL